MPANRVDVSVALEIGNYLGESPSWNDSEQALYFVNCEHPPELMRWHPESGGLQRWAMPARIGGFAKCSDGSFIVVLATGIHLLDLATGQLELLLATPLPQHIALHEAGIDRSGHLWVGSLNLETSATNPTPGGGKLFRIENGRFRVLDTDISCSNGLAFTADGSRAYYCDTSAGEVRYWDMDDQGPVGSKHEFLSVGQSEGKVDGAAIDTQGGYWVAMFAGSSVRRYLPDGSLDLQIQMPFACPTKVAFGGPALDDMFITTTRLQFPGVTYGQTSGHLYRMKPGFRGTPETLLDRATLAS